ncbi:cutinase family protein, partial [Escherichia coli]
MTPRSLVRIVGVVVATTLALVSA